MVSILGVSLLFISPQFVNATPKRDWTVTRLEENAYLVRGLVDADNAFGVSVRSRVFATYEFFEPGDALELLALKIDDAWVMDLYYAPFGEPKPE